MNILIKNAYNTFNYGSMMMVENVITYLNKFLKETEINFYIDTNDDIHINRLREATNHKNIFKDKIYGYKLITEKVKYVRYIERKLRENLFFKKKIKFYDVTIILGGDDYAETYFRIPQDNLAIKNVFKTLTKINENSNLFMIGQTIGPYTGERKEWAKETFKDIKIYSRDDVSAKYVLDELNKKVEISRDLAFLDLNLQPSYVGKKKELLDKYKLKENEYITLVGTGLIDCYTDNENDFLNSFINIIELLQNKYPKKKVVFLSHVVTPFPYPSDNVLIDKILNKKPKLKKELVIIKDTLLPVYARVILGCGYMTVTCRMHAAVSTFQMGKPAISLSYSPKYEGVIGKGLNCDELVIQCKDKQIWEGLIVNKIEGKIDYINTNYTSLKTKIEKEVKRSQDRIYDTLEDISKLI